MEYKQMSEHVHYSVAINRFVDLALTFFNTLVALMLITAPWYKLTLDLSGNDLFFGCALTRGTVIVPFSSGICEFTTMSELPGDAGKGWSTMHNYCIVYLSLALLISSAIGYESIVHGFRKWTNANTVSFGLNFVTLVIQIMILIESASVSKPKHIEDELAITFVTVALVMSCIRIPVLGWFMYHSKYELNDTSSWFGTGTSIY